jgi:hypothetical protein
MDRTEVCVFEEMHNAIFCGIKSLSLSLSLSLARSLARVLSLSLSLSQMCVCTLDLHAAFVGSHKFRNYCLSIVWG